MNNLTSNNVYLWDRLDRSLHNVSATALLCPALFKRLRTDSGVSTGTIVKSVTTVFVELGK